jgi:uncharacterized OB-fold protein
MGPEQIFLSHLAQGRFMLQRSRTSGKFFFHPRVAEPVTGSTDCEWVQASGLGTVYATTVTRPRAPATPYNVALIDLQEGPRMMSRVEGIAPEEIRIGMAVRARIERHGDAHVVVFDALKEGGHA